MLQEINLLARIFAFLCSLEAISWALTRLLSGRGYSTCALILARDRTDIIASGWWHENYNYYLSKLSCTQLLIKTCCLMELVRKGGKLGSKPLKFLINLKVLCNIIKITFYRNIIWHYYISRVFLSLILQHLIFAVSIKTIIELRRNEIVDEK